MGKGISVGNNNIINGAYNCVCGNNIVMVNGVIVSGQNVVVNGTAWAKSKRSFTCTAEADSLLITNKVNCSGVTITVDESIDKIIAEITATCSAPKKKQAEKMLENFDIKAVTKVEDGDRVVSFEPTEDSDNVWAEYNVKIPKSLNDILVFVSTADVDMDGFEGMATIRTTTGDVNLSHCVFRNSRVGTTTGNIRFMDNTLEKNLNLTATTGDISIFVNGGQGRITADVTTGNICLYNDFSSYRKIKQGVCGEQVFAKTDYGLITASTTTGSIKRI